LDAVHHSTRVAPNFAIEEINRAALQLCAGSDESPLKALEILRRAIHFKLSISAMMAILAI